jgi:DUF4097 and DUF4098 domain-containing protein YvlB
MKLQLFTAAAVLAVSTAALADGHFDRTLSVSATPDLYVQTGSGNVTVHPGNGNTLEVHARLKPGGGWGVFGASGDTDARIHRIEQDPPIKQDGNTIHIGEVSDRSLYNNISIDYDISIPSGAALNLRSGSGDIKISQVGRFLVASSGSGNITASGGKGTADVQTGSGDITLEQEGSGDVKARTGSGNIHIRGLNGSLAARAGSGNIDAEGRLTGPANLSSGSGNVKLHLGSDARFNLEASTGSGDIRIHYPGAPEQNEHSRHHMTAPINGGGPPLEVRTGSGDVEISS